MATAGIPNLVLDRLAEPYIWLLGRLNFPICTRAGNTTLLDSLASLSKANGISVVQHGARVAVIGEFPVSMLMHLPDSMRADIVESFRERIEDLMSLSDGRSLPEQYHSAFLTEVNRYLLALR